MSKYDKDYRKELPMADMHVDGVRFDPRILQALKNERAGFDMKKARWKGFQRARIKKRQSKFNPLINQNTTLIF